MSGRWDLLRTPSFLSYWLGYVLSALGDSVFMIAMMWMVVEMTGTGLIMGTLLTAFGLPRLVMILIGGVIVDRKNPRLIMIGSDLLRFAIMCVLFLFSISGHPPVWLLFVVALAFGAVDAFFWPAASAVQQRLVTPDRFVQSNSLLVGSMQAAHILGPLIGAVLFAFGGYKTAILFNALSFLISAITLMWVKLIATGTASKPPTEKRSMWSDVREGFAYVWNTPVILTMIIVAFFANAGANSVSVGLAFLAESFGVGAVGLSQMSAGWAVGGLIGAVLLASIVIRNPTPRMAILAFFLQGLAISLVFFTHNHWQVVLLLVLCGIASTAIQVISPSVSQKIIPPALMGRVTSVRTLVAMGSTPFAQAIAGWVIDLSGPSMVYLYGGLLAVLASGIAFFVPAIRRYDGSSAD